ELKAGARMAAVKPNHRKLRAGGDALRSLFESRVVLIVEHELRPEAMLAFDALIALDPDVRVLRADHFSEKEATHFHAAAGNRLESFDDIPRDAIDCIKVHVDANAGGVRLVPVQIFNVHRVGRSSRWIGAD